MRGVREKGRSRCDTVRPVRWSWVLTGEGWFHRKTLTSPESNLGPTVWHVLGSSSHHGRGTDGRGEWESYRYGPYGVPVREITVGGVRYVETQIQVGFHGKSDPGVV